MNNLLLNYCVIPIILTSTLISMFSNNLMIIWFIMEINNLMFIIYLMSMMNKKKMIFLYFIIQVMSSLLYMFSITFSPLLYSIFSHITFFMGLFMKTGLPPMHLWIISMSSCMTWIMIFLLITIQKVIPLYIFTLVYISPNLLMFIIIITMILPTVMMFNMSNFKKILIYSSINQSGWMILLIFMKNSFWFFYLLMYTSIMFSINWIMQISNLSNSFFQYMFKNFNMIFMILVMNMSGMPPFCFFMFKWMSTFLIIKNSSIHFIMVIMLLNSLVMTFIYIKMMTWSLFMSKFSLKMKNINQNMSSVNIIYCLLSLILPVILLI